MPTRHGQSSLFEAERGTIGVSPAAAAHRAVAAELPLSVRFGGMSWSYPGWQGSVYAEKAPAKELAQRGLEAYARHPLLRAVEIDRSYYEPLKAEAFASLAAQVPDDFRFVVKAHEHCTVRRFPGHARYGNKRNQHNPRYLDPAYAAEAVVANTRAGLGPKLGAILFQFPPAEQYDDAQFAWELREFLRGLPEGVTYAVEVRNPELVTARYSSVLADSGAVHCHNVWTTMPSVLSQAKQITPGARNPLIIRWLLRHRTSYEAASARFLPFDRLIDEDVGNREQIARLVVKATQHEVPAIVLVDNKAEGCAPESIARLAQTVADCFRRHQASL